MPKLFIYTCVDCGAPFEEILKDTEVPPDKLEDEKCKCGGTLVKGTEIDNIKNNCQVFRYNDSSHR